jgi:RNAse (barnase) inhibitor barstar
VTSTGQPYETQELFDLRERQGRQLDAAPDLSNQISIPAEVTGVQARAAELALRRAAEKIVAEHEYLSSYLDRCVNGRGPQLAIDLLVASGDRVALVSVLGTLLDRNMNGHLRTSEVPLTVSDPLSQWATAVSMASELALR